MPTLTRWLLVLTAPLALLAGCAGASRGGGAQMREAVAAPASRDEPMTEEAVAEPEKSVNETDGSPAGETAARRLSTESRLRARPPQMLARLSGAELEPLPLVSQDVTVVVSAHRARVVLDLVFRNTGAETVAGTLMVALPDRASPAALSMYQGGGTELAAEAEGLPAALLSAAPPTPDVALAALPVLGAKWTTGEITVDWGELRGSVVVDPIQGRQVYEAVTRARVDPALAEWSGSGSYSARIYPIPGGGLKRVVFTYDQTLVPSNGKLQLVLPAPTAVAGAGRLTVHDLNGGASEVTVTADGQTVTPGRGVAGARTWTLAGGSIQTALYTAVPRNPALLTLAGTDPLVPGTLVTLLHTPDLPRQTLLRPTGRALVLLDTSASGRELLAGLQAELLKTLLETDDSLTEFALVAFDVRATLLTPGFVANTAEARAHYLDLVEQIWLEGSTAFETALEYVEATPELDRAQTIFLLSDGEITWGVDGPAALARDHAALLARRWVCYAFGTTPHNRRLFDTLTREAGQTVQISLGQPLEEAAKAHRYPVYHLDHVVSVLQDEVVVEGSPALIYPGQVLSIAVRVLRPGTELRLLLGVDGRDLEVRVPVTRQPATDALASRAWGEMYVGTLLDEPEQREIAAIQALSRHFRLTNDYASFLILDTDADLERYAVDLTPLDFRQVRQTLGTRVSPSAPARPVLSGLEIPDELPAEAAETLVSLTRLGDLEIWSGRAQVTTVWAPRFILGEPAVKPDGSGSTALYLAARSLMDLAGMAPANATAVKHDPELYSAQALRTLATIAETRPRDDQALRLTGYVLMQWGLYDEAGNLFARVRGRRPFEPQNALLEALALAAQGKAAAAALRYEIVLGQTFPRFQDSSRPVAARLYADLLGAALRAHPDHPDRALWQGRLDAALLALGEQTRGAQPGETPAGRLILFWNIDDTDVDLHVREGLFSEVWYGRMSSLGGGRLYWDNTEGLGPELYEHPRLGLGGFRVSVDYFGSSSVEGSAPAATFVAAFTRSGRDPRYAVGWHTTVLVGEQDDTVQIMPIWRR